MANKQVEVIHGVVDGNKPGSKISVPEKSAEKLAAKGMVKYVQQSQPKQQSKKPATKQPEAKESAPKSPASKDAKPSATKSQPKEVPTKEAQKTDEK